MSKICTNCGKELKDSAKFCGKCGSKVEAAVAAPLEEKAPICGNCGSELRSGALFCDQCGSKVEEAVKEWKCKRCGIELREGSLFCDKCGEPFGEPKRVDTADEKELLKGKFEDRKKAVSQYTDTVKEKGKGFVGTIKNCKNLSKKKKRNIIITLGGVVAAIAIALIILIPNFSGVSDKVVSEAALQVAEKDYGYKLELTSYDIIDSFTAKSTNINGDTVKAKMYLVIVEATAKDNNGEVVETVKYGISVVDPKKSGDYVSCSPMSQAQNFTDMDNKEIEEQLRSATAHLH